MSFRTFISDGWSWFFGIIAITIFVTLTAPAAFGLQNFTQWGGMYDDHWCHAETYPANPHENPDVPHEEITAGDMGYPIVYSAPSHNRESCLIWVQVLCGQKSKDGWTIAWVEPKLQSQMYLGEVNACDVRQSKTSRWYFHAQF